MRSKNPQFQTAFILFAIFILVLSMKVFAPSHPVIIEKECAVTDSEKTAILNALLNYNSSWSSYNVKELKNLYCYLAPLYPEPYPEPYLRKPYPLAEQPTETVTGEIAAGGAGAGEAAVQPSVGVIYPNATEPTYPPPLPEPLKNVKFVSGMLELRNSAEDIKFLTVFFTVSIDESGAVTVHSAWEQENYDFEKFFSKEENEKLDYTLKKLIIDLHLGDIEDKSIWVSLQRTWYGIRPLAEESVETSILPPLPEDCSEFKKTFEEFVAKFNVEDKFYLEQPYSCLGLVKVKISQVRGLVQYIPDNHMLSYYGDTLRFSYNGEAAVAVDLQSVLAKLKEEGCVVISNYNYPEDISDKKCVAYFNERQFSFYFNKQYGVSRFGDNVWVDANLWGPMSGKGTLNVYLSGDKADSYAPFVEQELEDILRSAGIDVDIKLQRHEEKFQEPTVCIMIYPPPPGCEPDDEDVSKSPVIVSSYVYYTFSQEIQIHDQAPNWPSEEQYNVIYYRNGNAGIMITKASISVNKYNENEYWYAEFTEDSVRTTVVLDEFNLEKAKQKLSESVANYVSVPADAWKVDYYPVGGGGYPVLYYALEKGAAVSAVAIATSGEVAKPSVAPSISQIAEKEKERSAEAVASEAQDFREWVKEEAQKEEEQKFTVQKFFDGIFGWIFRLFE